MSGTRQRGSFVCGFFHVARCCPGSSAWQRFVLSPTPSCVCPTLWPCVRRPQTLGCSCLRLLGWRHCDHGVQEALPAPAVSLLGGAQEVELLDHVGTAVPFLKNCQAVSHGGHTISQPLPQGTRAPVPPYPHQHCSLTALKTARLCTVGNVSVSSLH